MLLKDYVRNVQNVDNQNDIDRVEDKCYMKKNAHVIWAFFFDNILVLSAH